MLGRVFASGWLPTVAGWLIGMPNDNWRWPGSGRVTQHIKRSQRQWQWRRGRRRCDLPGSNKNDLTFFFEEPKQRQRERERQQRNCNTHLAKTLLHIKNIYRAESSRRRGEGREAGLGEKEPQSSKAKQSNWIRICVSVSNLAWSQPTNGQQMSSWERGEWGAAEGRKRRVNAVNTVNK